MRDVDITFCGNRTLLLDVFCMERENVRKSNAPPLYSIINILSLQWFFELIQHRTFNGAAEFVRCCHEILTAA